MLKPKIIFPPLHLAPNTKHPSTNMGLITLVQGFKLSVAKFDNFLKANRLNPTEGYHPFPEEAADTAKLFRAKGMNCKVKVFIPYVAGFSRLQHLFVCCNWIYVLASREIEGELQKPVPSTFENIRKLLQAKSGVLRYVVYNNEDETSWIPEELIKRNTVDQPT